MIGEVILSTAECRRLVGDVCSADWILRCGYVWSYGTCVRDSVHNRAGRVDVCWDPGYNVIGNVISSSSIGSVAGAEIHHLTATQIPGHTHNGTTDDLRDHRAHMGPVVGYDR
jgi:hypothetical protein